MKLTCPLGHCCEKRDETGQPVERCQWYVKVYGRHPQTEELVDKWACSIAFMPMLQIESSQQMRQAGAAVESFRNEMVSGNEKFLGLISQAKRLANAREDR